MTFVFKHPKYYKELRSRNKLDQAISLRAKDDGSRPQATSFEAASDERAPGPEMVTVP